MTTDNEAATPFHMQMSDIRCEPLRILMPIMGYEKMPLVSLEEAIEPIVCILPDIHKHALIAKQGWRQSADGLSRDESASIILHSMVWEPYDQCLYFVLNAMLRSKDRSKLRPWFLYLRLILNALWKLPSRRQTMYMGLKMDFSARYRSGQEVVWWGFASCTSDFKTLENELCLSKTSSPRTLLIIECNNAKDITQYSYTKLQNHLLLLPGQAFQVTSCFQQSDHLHLFALKQTDPLYPLPEPVPVPPHPSPKPVRVSFPADLFMASSGMGVRFVDVSNDAGLKRVPWSNHAPAWRRAVRGICLEGTCTTKTCEAFSQQVIIRIGMGKFDLVLDSNASTCQCPMCHQYVEPIKCSFNNCDWRWSGIKQLPGKAPEKCSSGDEWSYADDAYHYFDEAVSGQVVWRQLIFETREHR